MVVLGGGAVSYGRGIPVVHDESASGRSVNCREIGIICTVLLDPRDPLLHSERTQGFAAGSRRRKGEVVACVGLIHNLKDQIAEPPAPAPHLARPEGYAALRIVLVTVPHVSHSVITLS